MLLFLVPDQPAKSFAAAQDSVYIFLPGQFFPYIALVVRSCAAEMYFSPHCHWEQHFRGAFLQQLCLLNLCLLSHCEPGLHCSLFSWEPPRRTEVYAVEEATMRAEDKVCALSIGWSLIWNVSLQLDDGLLCIWLPLGFDGIDNTQLVTGKQLWVHSHSFNMLRCPASTRNE